MSYERGQRKGAIAMKASGTGQLEQVEQWQSMDIHQFEGGLWIGHELCKMLVVRCCQLS